MVSFVGESNFESHSGRSLVPSGICCWPPYVCRYAGVAMEAENNSSF